MTRRAAKRQVVVVHGGQTWKTHGAYISFLRKLKVDFERYRFPRRRKGWKRGLGAALGPRYEVIALDMPAALNAKYDEWSIWFEKFIPHLKSSVVLVGHSLGGLFLAKYLSEKHFPKKICATLLVAPAEGGGDMPFVKDFKGFERQGGTIILYQSKDDPLVPYSDSRRYQKRLPNAIARIFAHRGHFNQASFPELVRDIKGLY